MGIKTTAYYEHYKDLDLCFKIHPLYADVVPVIELDAIRNSVKNILLTQPGGRPFNPEFGCNLQSYLFENYDAFIGIEIQETVKVALRLFEPRIRVIDVTVIDNMQRNALEILINAEITNEQAEVEITVLLERVR